MGRDHSTYDFSAFCVFWVDEDVNENQIAAAIASWHRRLSLASENLLSIYETEAMKRLEGRGGCPAVVVAGTTAERVLPAVETLKTLFDQLEKLRATVGKAEILHGSLPRFLHREESLREIDALLVGPSIVLGTTDTPLARRSLLMAAEQQRTVTPEELLSQMDARFEQAKKEILALDAAWNRLEVQLGAAMAKYDQLSRLAQSAHVEAPELARLPMQIDQTKERIGHDPLGADRVLEGVQESLRRAKDALEAVAETRVVAAERLAALSPLLVELSTRREACQLSWQLAGREWDDATVQPPLPESQLLELVRWRTRLELAFQAGNWSAAHVGAEKLHEQIADALLRERQAHEANEALAGLRAELAGRLGILRARAAAAGDPALDRLLLQAAALLAERPTPGDRASKLIAACEARLRAQHREGLAK